MKDVMRVKREEEKGVCVDEWADLRRPRVFWKSGDGGSDERRRTMATVDSESNNKLAY